MPQTIDESNALFNQSVDKGLSVLLAFNTQRRTMTIAEVAEAAAMGKSSAQRMVFTLEQLGYLRKHPRTRRYLLTTRVLELGFNYLASNVLIEIANPFLSELSNVTRETTCLTEPDRLNMVYIARYVSAQFVPLHMPIGSNVPMYCTASGRAYLSALDEGSARSIIERSDRRPHTRHTSTDADEIMDKLGDCRRDGFALNREEMFLGDMNLAAPVLDSRGHPIGAVHVVAPTSRWSVEDAVQNLAPKLLQCARSVTMAMRTAD